MEVGPNRASLFHIGYDSLQGLDEDKMPIKKIMDEIAAISPVLKWVGIGHGYNKFAYILFTAMQLGECLLYLNAMLINDKADIINISAFASSAFLLLVNMLQAKNIAFKQVSKLAGGGVRGHAGRARVRSHMRSHAHERASHMNFAGTSATSPAAGGVRGVSPRQHSRLPRFCRRRAAPAPPAAAPPCDLRARAPFSPLACPLLAAEKQRRQSGGA
jgi:hypothetical protein